MVQYEISARTRTLIGTTIVALLLTACGSGSEEQTSATGSAQNAPVPATSASPAGAVPPVGSTQPAASAQPANSTAPVSSAPPVASTPAVIPPAPVASAPPPAAATAPTISGSPATSARAGSAYAFQPSAADANGDTLGFSISNKPAWATFNTATGKLSGTPAAGDQGSFNNITITVSDGLLSATLAPFSILVSPSASASVTLSWTPPTTNTDGSTINTLAGYKIYYGTSADALTNVIQVTNPGLTSYTVGNLATGTHYFSIAAYTTNGIEGEQSGVGSMTL